MDISDAKKCQCGCASPQLVEKSFNGRSESNSQVCCPLCGLAAPALDDVIGAIKSWNVIQQQFIDAMTCNRLKELVNETNEALQNLMGLYDTPLERRNKGDDSFYKEAIKIARKALESVK